jgi:hypothetical protein
VGLEENDMQSMHALKTHKAFTKFFASQTRQQLDRLAISKDIPLHTLAKQNNWLRHTALCALCCVMHMFNMYLPNAVTDAKPLAMDFGRTVSPYRVLSLQ